MTLTVCCNHLPVSVGAIYINFDHVTCFTVIVFLSTSKPQLIKKTIMEAWEKQLSFSAVFIKYYQYFVYL